MSTAMHKARPSSRALWLYSFVRCPRFFIEFVSVKAQRNIDRNANAKRSVLQSNLSIGTLLSVPFVRSEACRAKGNHMRTLVEPPPSSR
jgi:hypothetical protein